jgi:hypothetical protein
VKRFLKFLSRVPPELREVYRAANRVPCMRPGEVDGKFFFFLRPEELSAGRPPSVAPQAWADVLGLYAQDGASGMLEFWILAGLLGGGPRVYSPTREEFESLAHVDNRMPWSVYRQPFETMVVIVPPGVYGSPVSPEFDWPAFAVCRHDPQRRVLGLEIVPARGLERGTALTTSASWASDSAETIEDHLVRLPDRGLTAAQSECIHVVRRAVINANMLLTHHGARPLGPADPGRHADLRALLENGNRAARRAAGRELADLPLVYGFDQHVRVYEVEGAHGPGGETGREVRPHWRRGHWANVACGAGRPSASAARTATPASP